MQSDNRMEFVNKIIKELVKSASIDHRLITPYHPQANGVAEWFVQTTLQGIRK